MRVRALFGARPSLFAAASLVALGTGCLTEVDRPDTATFYVDAAGEVQVVTSTRFEAPSSTVSLVVADTVVVTGRHEGTIALGNPTRFFIRATSLSDGNLVAMQVLIGQKRWYDGRETLEADQSLQFMYGFSGAF